MQKEEFINKIVNFVEKTSGAGVVNQNVIKALECELAEEHLWN